MNTRIFRRSLTADSAPVEPGANSPPQPETSQQPDVMRPSQRMPLALRQLQSYNQPGHKEGDIPVSNKRVTRQSNNNGQ